MTNLHRAGQLDNVVTRVLALNNTTRFRQYWELYKQTAEVSEIQNLFIRTEESEGYCNIAIMGDGRIADIEGDDGDSSGAINIYPLRSVSEVALHRGALPSLSRSKGASLVVLLSLTGQDESGPYWIAKTPEEEAQLISFARSLVQLISDR